MSRSPSRLRPTMYGRVKETSLILFARSLASEKKNKKKRETFRFEKRGIYSAE